MVKHKKSGKIRKKRRRWTKVVTYTTLFMMLAATVTYMTVWLKYDQPLTYEVSGAYKHISSAQILEIIGEETTDKGYLFLNTQQLEQKLQKTNLFKEVRIQKGTFRTIHIFVEEKKLVMKQYREKTSVAFDDTGQSFGVDIPTNLPMLDARVKAEDVTTIAEALSAQSDVLLQQISEISYAYVGEARTEVKLITIQGDIIYAKLNELKTKLPHFLEIDTIMNQKNIMKCEYHFEYNNGSVVVNEMK